MKKLILFILPVVFLTVPIKAGLLPPAGQDILSDTIGWVTIEMQPAYGGHILDGVLYGDTIVNRGDPYPDTSMGGDETIDTEMVSLDLVGFVGGMPAEIHLQEPPTISPGQIIDTNPDPNNSFPAYSFFDIFFEITVSDTPFGILSLHNDIPLLMKSTINGIPPDLSETPYLAAIESLPLPLYNDNDEHIADMTYAKHSPEPSTIVLLGIGGLLLRRRKRS